MRKDKRLIGRGSEVLMNEKLFKIIKQLETLSLNKDDKLISNPDEEKGLWIDPSSEDDLKYYKNGQWHLFYKNKFKITTEILEPYMPKDPVPGQLWINDGILMYFDGMKWMVIKAGDINKEEFNISNYYDFVLIDPLIEQGNLIVDSTAGRPIEKSQFLIPNEKTTKFFIDGFINKDYDRVTNVAIQYETARMKNKIAAAAHINPSNLIDIEKKLILIDKSPSGNLVRINTHNCEIYGMTHGRGRLLLQEVDYIRTSGNYIKLRERAQKKFDFLLIIRYIFGKTTHKGKMLSQEIDIKNNTSSSIRIKDDPLEYRYFIAQDGLIQTIDRDAYTIQGDQLILNNIKKDKNTQILSFHFDNLLDRGVVEDSKITIPNEEDQRVIIILENNKGYKIISSEVKNEEVILENINNGSYYILFKEDRNPNKKSLKYKESGIVEDGKIITDIIGREKILLTIDGYIIPKTEYSIDYAEKEIKINPKYDYQSYVIYNDNDNNILLDEKIKDVIIPLNLNDDIRYNKTIAYIDEHIICDNSTVLSYNLPAKGEPNEIRKVVNASGSPKWYIYSKGEWERLVQPRKKTIDIIKPNSNINKPNRVEVYNKYDHNEIRMEVKRSISKYFNIPQNEIKDLKIEVYKNKVIATSVGEQFNFLINEVEIKIPDYVYSYEIDLLKKTYKNKVDQNTSEYLEGKIIETINKEIKQTNIHNRLRVLTDLDLTKDTAIVKVVQDNSLDGYKDYKEGVGILEHLEFTINSYSEGDNIINVSNHFDGDQLRTYSYRFASHIDKPRKIKEMEIDLKNNDKGFMIDYYKYYEPRSNELSVYLDGVKQYDFLETSNKSFKFKGEYKEGDPRFAKLICVSEPTEKDNSISCQREIVELSKETPGMFNTYKTNIDLFPGYNRIFIDGIRQSPESYEILDANTIILKNINKKLSCSSKMLIEHKNDLSINEHTIYINGPLKGGIIDINKYEIDHSILETGEELLIYIDGVLLGNQYIIDRETESIIITSEVAQYIGKNMVYYEAVIEHQKAIEKYMEMLESEDLEWKEKEKVLQKINDLEEVISKYNINDTISIMFEWR